MQYNEDTIEEIKQNQNFADKINLKRPLEN